MHNPAFSFKALFRLSPPSAFGLPDRDKLVVPMSPAPADISGPMIDTRTGLQVAHGTLSKYRKEAAAINLKFGLSGMAATLRDNFLTVELRGTNPQLAAENAYASVRKFLQALSLLEKNRFEATLLSFDDANGKAQQVHLELRKLTSLDISIYNTQELAEKVKAAAAWAEMKDQASEKALFYYEHASLLYEFSRTLPFRSPHATLSRAMAFLQLFKALTSLIGDPSSDKDYQSRAKKIGLAPDFWKDKAKPLYEIRNDSDVAHYSKSMPEPHAFLEAYEQAVEVFTEALRAHIAYLERQVGKVGKVGGSPNT